MHITILGNGSACNGPNQASSGYLVRENATTLLMDCGTGIMGRLQTQCRPDQLSAIVLSHVHWDHWCDLMPLRYWFLYAQRSNPACRIPLILPPGGRAVIDQVSMITQAFDGPISSYFDTCEYTPGETLQIGDIELSFRLMHHYSDSHAIRLQSKTGTLVYSGDTGPEGALAEFAAGADTLLSEASTQGVKPEQAWGHLSAAEAGMAAAGAGVKRLLLTHIAAALDPARSVEEARSVFSGDVRWAEELQTYVV
ncbi:MAG TPA: MBL fold metallo-hydrolase [Symbiobacteriaceae bacterium]|nr:MBL fold metallo-hydrolase [Symbiobacteriaceae bacterium]